VSQGPPRTGPGAAGVPGQELGAPAGFHPLQVRFAAQRPEVERFWVRYAPRGWEGPPRLWLDLAAGQLGRPGFGGRGEGEGRGGRGGKGIAPRGDSVAATPPPEESAALEVGFSPGAGGRNAPGVADSPEHGPGIALADAAAAGWLGSGAAPFDDLVYLPPVAPRWAGERDALARRVLASGAPVLMQLLPGDRTTLAGREATEPAAAGLVIVLDLLATLLDGDLPATIADGGLLGSLLDGGQTESPGEVGQLGSPLDGRLSESSPEDGLRWSPSIPARAVVAVWPLVPGLTDDAVAWEAGCRALAAAGLRVVQATVPALMPGDRRRLAEETLLGEARGEEAYRALFHRPLHPPPSPPTPLPMPTPHLLRTSPLAPTVELLPTPPLAPPAQLAEPPDSEAPPEAPHPSRHLHPVDSERNFARLAWWHGLTPFLRRPSPRPPLLGAENRRAAGLLALVAELWLRLGRPVEQAQSLFRAARWLDGTSYDIGALRREGNLAVLTALDPVARQIVASAAGQAEPPLLAALLADYLAPDSADRGAGGLNRSCSEPELSGED
jgi:hypothetical protein